MKKLIYLITLILLCITSLWIGKTVYSESDSITNQTTLEVSSYNTQEIDIILLAYLIWGEARGESELSQISVAWVVRNRVQANKEYFGDDWVDVILKSNQFSFFNTNTQSNFTDFVEDRNRDKLIDIAKQVYYGQGEDPTDGAICYVQKDLKGKLIWMKDLEYIRDIGSHSFYRKIAIGN